MRPFLWVLCRCGQSPKMPTFSPGFGHKKSTAIRGAFLVPFGPFHSLRGVPLKLPPSAFGLRIRVLSGRLTRPAKTWSSRTPWSRWMLLLVFFYIFVI